MKTLPDTMRYKRERLRWTATELSRKAKFSPSYVSKIESGKIEPSFAAVAKLFQVLRFTDEEILFSVKVAGTEALQEGDK